MEVWLPLRVYFQSLGRPKNYRSSDLDRLIVTDSPQQAVAVITDAAKRRFGLTYGPRLKRHWFFNEVEPS